MYEMSCPVCGQYIDVTEAYQEGRDTMYREIISKHANEIKLARDKDETLSVIEDFIRWVGTHADEYLHIETDEDLRRYMVKLLLVYKEKYL